MVSGKRIQAVKQGGSGRGRSYLSDVDGHDHAERWEPPDGIGEGSRELDVLLLAVEQDVGAGELRTADQSACIPVTGEILTRRGGRGYQATCADALGTAV